MARFYPLQIKSKKQETADCVSLTFDVPAEFQDKFQFVQGQHLALRTTINNENVTRSYSICSSPNDKVLTIAVKKVPEGSFSTYANDLLQPGEVVEVMPPAGHFYTPLDATNEKNYLAVTAGSGITPIISIIKTTLETEPKSNFTLLFSNKNTDSIIFHEDLEDLKNQFLGRFSIHHFFTREKVDNPLFFGRLDKNKLNDLNRLIDYKTTDEVFICGPEEMISEVSQTLEGLGIAKKHIHFELFTSPVGKLGQSSSKKKPISEVVDSTVTILMDGIAYEFPADSDSSILELANKKGADLPFSCKGGVCSTCKAKITEGEVEMKTNYALELEEIQAGYVLTCQAHPLTKRVVISFDEG